jgi:hypothetical protein
LTAGLLDCCDVVVVVVVVVEIEVGLGSEVQILTVN